MTLAAGFLCADGIVLARATERSGQIAKWTPTEIFRHTSAQYELAVTGAGDDALIRMAADHLLQRELDDDDDLSELQEKSERMVNRLSKKYIFCHGERDTQRPQLQLLVAARMSGGAQLLLSGSENRLARSDGCEFVGTGRELARSVASWLYEPTLPVGVVSRLAIQVLQWTAEHVPGCGRAGQILCLSGAAQPAVAQHIALEGEFFWGLNALLQPILTGCLDERIGDVQFDDRLRWFEERMSAVRQALGEERQRDSHASAASQPHS